jgi:hypothetical protein
MLKGLLKLISQYQFKIKLDKMKPHVESLTLQPKIEWENDHINPFIIRLYQKLS